MQEEENDERSLHNDVVGLCYHDSQLKGKETGGGFDFDLWFPFLSKYDQPFITSNALLGSIPACGDLPVPGSDKLTFTT